MRASVEQRIYTFQTLCGIAVADASHVRRVFGKRRSVLPGSPHQEAHA